MMGMFTCFMKCLNMYINENMLITQGKKWEVVAEVKHRGTIQKSFLKAWELEHNLRCVSVL